MPTYTKMICEEKIKRCLSPTEKNIILTMEIFKLKGNTYVRCSELIHYLCLDTSNFHKSLNKLESRGLVLTLSNNGFKEVIL